MIFFCPERLGDFFCLERLCDFFVPRDWVIFLSQDVGCFSWPERLVNFFCPKSLGDFFSSSREVG